MATVSPRPMQAGEMEAILRGLDGRIKPVRVSIFYQFGMLLVAAAMIILPLIYLALIAAVAYGVYYHAVYNTVILNDMRTVRYTILIYILPIIVGIMVILFMLKPLFAPPGRGGIPGRALKAEDQPLLFEFVRRLCKVIGVRMPARIEVDCSINAFAGARSALGVLFGRNMILCVGLPLAAGMNLRQFAGILAHEFGHFGQGFGWFLKAIVDKVNLWFARVVYQRDAWDEALHAGTNDPENGIVQVFSYAIIAMVWLSRRVLWVLMHIGHLISCFMTRQSEYDADRYEVRVSGSKSFCETSITLECLDLAWGKSQMDMGQAFDERRLGDNLPALILDNYAKINDEAREKIRELVSKRRTGLFDTHPSTRARMKRAAKLNEKGIFLDERPATILFSNFEELCKDVTMDLYAARLGPAVVHNTLVPTSELIGRREAASAGFDALKQFCFGYIAFLKLLGPDPGALEAPADPRAVVGDLQRARNYFVNAFQIIKPAFQRYEMAWHVYLKGAEIDQKIQAGITGRSATAAVEQILEKGKSMRQEADMEIAAFDDALLRRLTAALKLLHTPQVQERIEGGKDLARQSVRLAAGIDGIRACSDLVIGLVIAHHGLKTLLMNLKGNEEESRMQSRIRAMRGEVYRLIDALFMRLKNTPYPFEHPNGQISVGTYVIEMPPHREDLQAIFIKGKDTLDSIERLYFRMMGALAHMALQVEQVLGLAPILPPPEEQETKSAQ